VEEKVMKQKTIMAVLILSLVVSTFMPVHKVEAAGVSSKSVVVTFDKKKSYHSFRIKLNKEVTALADIKILQVTGKANQKGKIYYGSVGCVDGIGSCFENLTSKDFKKGKVLHSDWGVYKNGGVTFDLPRGIKKMKVKITFKTSDNSKSITLVKETKVEDYYAYNKGFD
jgi:hypothetical protein